MGWVLNSEVKVTQLCLTLCDPMDYTVRGILQTGILDFPFSSRSSLPRNQTGVSCIAGGFFTNWAMREAQVLDKHFIIFFFFFLNMFIIQMILTWLWYVLQRVVGKALAFNTLLPLVQRKIYIFSECEWNKLLKTSHVNKKKKEDKSIVTLQITYIWCIDKHSQTHPWAHQHNFLWTLQWPYKINNLTILYYLLMD